jgi:cytochrome P450 family 2 subfamily J
MLVILKLFSGISLSEGSLWKEQRRFALTSLRNLGMGKGWLEDTMLTEIAQLIHTFGTFSLPFNPCSHLTLSVSNNICALLLGKRFQHSDKKFIRLCGLFGENFRLTAHLLPVGFLPFLKDLPFSRFRKLIRLFFKNIEDVKTFCQQLITEHKLKLAGHTKDEDKQDFIDRYLSEQNKQIIQHGSKMSFEGNQCTLLNSKVCIQL